MEMLWRVCALHSLSAPPPTPLLLLPVLSLEVVDTDESEAWLVVESVDSGEADSGDIALSS